MIFTKNGVRYMVVARAPDAWLLLREEPRPAFYPETWAPDWWRPIAGYPV
jgi:hypothetical protein